MLNYIENKIVNNIIIEKFKKKNKTFSKSPCPYIWVYKPPNNYKLSV